MTGTEMIWIGGASVERQHGSLMCSENEYRSPSWLPTTALASREYLTFYISLDAAEVPVRRQDCLMILRAATRRREWTPKACRFRRGGRSDTGNEVSGVEALAYVAEILTLGEFSEFGREPIHDFAVNRVSGRVEIFEEPESGSIETLNYAKIVGYLPMPSRLDKLVR